jgi:hypothetical protein
LAALLLSVVVLSGASRAGARFFHCRMMDTLTAAPCCLHAAERPTQPDGPVLGSPALACCEPGSLPPMPRASAVRAPEPPLAPLVAMVPAVDARAGVVAASMSRRPGFVHARAAPQPPSAAERCARLSVFLV